MRQAENGTSFRFRDLLTASKILDLRRSLSIICVALACALIPVRELPAQTDVIRGRVLNAEGTPLPNVRVTATSIPGNVTRESRTNARGQFQITFPGGSGDYVMGFALLRHAFRQFELKRTADHDVLIANARLSRVQLDTVNVVSTMRLSALRKFVERGGLLITTGGTSRLPVEMGFNNTVSVVTTTRLNARGVIYRAQAVSLASPILYGYENPTFPIYFNQSPLLSVTVRDTLANVDGIDAAILQQREKVRARVILRFHEKADSLLVSGLLVAGDEMAGRAAVVDAPLGKGHVVLFGIRPLWRWESQGSFALAINAIANWNHLSF